MDRDIETKYDVFPFPKDTEVELLLVKKKYRKNIIYSIDISAYNSYDKPITIVYADHLDTTLEQLDSWIATLQAVRQDLDVTHGIKE